MLEAAHRGYDYQDLLVALRLPALLTTSSQIEAVDKKLVADDRFDDLTISTESGLRQRIQIKHSTTAGPLALSTFTSDERSLRLDGLVRAALLDHKARGNPTRASEYRVILTNDIPDDPRLLSALTKSSAPEFVAGFRTSRFRLSVDSIWPLDTSSTGTPLKPTQTAKYTRNELVWFLDNFIIELNSPRASFDLTKPDEAEKLLLSLTRNEIGAETFPNAHRSCIDVAQGLIHVARASRQGTTRATREEVSRRIQIQRDFGAVSRAHPVDESKQVRRPPTVQALQVSTAKAATDRRPLVITAPPGQGKSWACHQLVQGLLKDDWVVAEHYCYLGQLDEARSLRAESERLLGSLLLRLEDAVPGVLDAQRPRFAATVKHLENAVRAIINRTNGRRVALVVDGLDHVSRVLGQGQARSDPSTNLARLLANLDLPPGCALVVLSQPGAHLEPLTSGNAFSLALSPLDDGEVLGVAEALGLWTDLGIVADVHKETRDRLGREIVQKASGNALYARYICLELIRHRANLPSTGLSVGAILPFQNSLEQYYAYLMDGIDEPAGWIADTLALLEFAVTRHDLSQIRPAAAHRVDKALGRLVPVLIELPSQGGLRVYHESFARYLREPLANRPDARQAIQREVCAWLRGLGFMQDDRAYRFLLPLLAESNQAQSAMELITPSFVSDSIAMCFSPAAIRTNLANCITCAAPLGDWPKIVTCVELSRALDSMDTEAIETRLVECADIVCAIIGPAQYARRLLFDSKTTYRPAAGLKLCAAVDERGGVAPWKEYLHAFERERGLSAGDEQADEQLSLAQMRARLRFLPEELQSSCHLVQSVLKEKLAPPQKVVPAIADVLGTRVLLDAILHEPGYFYSKAALARTLWLGGARDAAREVASRLRNHVPTGEWSFLLEMGLSPADLGADLPDLSSSTKSVVDPSVDDRPKAIAEWLDNLSIAAATEPSSLRSAETLVHGEGWYPCWLRFAFALATMGSQKDPDDQARSAVAALQLLEHDLRPFAGSPRACDLWSIREFIRSTIGRALSAVDDARWEQALGILSRVADGVAVTLRGEMAGPIPFDDLIELVVSRSSPERRNITTHFIDRVIRNHSSFRYYSDLASFEISRARLALKCSDIALTKQHWSQACVYSVAYGWHKDTTIFDLLKPISELSNTNLERGRRAVAKTQSLAERALQHSDGKETRHAPATWWDTAAKADPYAVAAILTPLLLGQTNLPNSRLENARLRIWEHHHNQVPPAIAAALRITLEPGLTDEDESAVARLIPEAGAEPAATLLRLLLGRIDERPFRYSVSNSDELVARDDVVVGRIGEMCRPLGLELARFASDQRSTERRTSTARRKDERLLGLTESAHTGVQSQIRAWHLRPWSERDEEDAISKYSVAIGFGLVDMCQSDGETAACDAIRLLAIDVRFGDAGWRLLQTLGQGLERHGHLNAAATAFAFAWTRRRSGGGWLAFGGEEVAGTLASALSLSEAVTLRVVAEEVHRVVADNGSALGITQSLVRGFLAAHQPSNPDRLRWQKLAFDSWDAAFETVSRRLPAVDGESDISDSWRYAPSDGTRMSEDDLVTAFIMATLGGLAHPARERKRCALVALKLLLCVSPSQVYGPLRVVFSNVADAITLTAVLRLVWEGGNAVTMCANCRDELISLSRSGFLEVRTLARSILSAGAVGLPPLLLEEFPVGIGLELAPRIVIPRRTVRPQMIEPRDAMMTEMINRHAELRVAHAEALVSGMTSAIHQGVSQRLNDTSYRSRIRAQLDALSSPASNRIPNAVLAFDEAIEEEIQRTTGFARSALIRRSESPGDPDAFEADFVEGIRAPIQVSIRMEAAREPRPPYPLPFAEPANRSGPGLQARPPWTSVPTVQSGKWTGWKVIAHWERGLNETSIGARNTIQTVTVCGCAQLGAAAPDGVFPFGKGNEEVWRLPVRPSPPGVRLAGPVAGMCLEGIHIEGVSRLLGIDTPLLAPFPGVVSLLDLIPTSEHQLVDRTATIGLLSRSWRTRYREDPYHLVRPLIVGTELLLRPDLFDLLRNHCGHEIGWLDAVVASEEADN